MGNIRKPKISKPGLFSRYWSWIAISLVVLFIAIIRIRLLQTPLERDEGEYAYMGQLMLQGIPPYKLACNMKLPGTYAAYAIIMALFGQSISGVHLGLVFANAATIILMFLLARRLFGQLAGVVAGATYGILSVSSAFYGQAAHATHFVVLAALGGTLLLLKAIDSGKRSHLFLSGLLFGVSVLMKQSGIFFSLFAMVYLFWGQKKSRRTQLSNLATLLLGIVLPLGLTCLILWDVGVFDRFWFWTVTYAREYSSQISFSKALCIFKSAITEAMDPARILWIISGLGLIALIIDKDTRSKARFVIGFTICAFATVFPGFHFREHYFIQFIPALALLAGIGVSAFRRILDASRLPAFISLLPIVFFAVAFVHTVDLRKDEFFVMSPDQVCRKIYFGNPFVESIKIADYIKRHSNQGDTIAVIGSEPQIYFYSKRHSATSYIYTYPLMEDQKYALGMQGDMIREMIAAKPKYLVYVHIPVSWFVGPKSKMVIFNWMNKELDKNFEMVGVADMSSGSTRYVWGEDAAHYMPKSRSRVLIFLRKDAS